MSPLSLHPLLEDYEDDNKSNFGHSSDDNDNNMSHSPVSR